MSYQFAANAPKGFLDPTSSILATPAVDWSFQSLPLDMSPSRMASNEMDLNVDSSRMTAYVDIAVAIAQSIAKRPEYLSAFTPKGCGTGVALDPGEESCEIQFVKQFGKSLFRAPLDETNVSELVSGRPTWIALISRVLTHPQFLFRMDRFGDAVPGVSNSYALNAYELESRLTSIYWKSIPDAEGLAAAASGSILTPKGLEAEVERLLSKPRAKEVVWRFYSQWLGADRISEFGLNGTGQYFAFAQPLNASHFPGLRDAVLRDARQFVEHFTWTVPGRIDDLLTSTLIFNTDPALALIYQIPPRASESAPPSKNANFPGILSRPIVTTQKAQGTETNHIQRGVFISTNILGITLGAPANALAQSEGGEAIPENASTRVRAARTTSASICMACHALINPNGFVLGRYDALGRYANTELSYDGLGNVVASNRIDPSGKTGYGDKASEHSFADLPGYLAGLVASQKVPKAFAQYYFRFAMGRPDDQKGKDACLLQHLEANLNGPGGSIQKMLKTFPLSTCFKVSSAP